MVTSDGQDYFGPDLCGVIAIGGSLGIGLGSGLGFWLKNSSSRLLAFSSVRQPGDL